MRLLAAPVTVTMISETQNCSTVYVKLTGKTTIFK